MGKLVALVAVLAACHAPSTPADHPDAAYVDSTAADAPAGGVDAGGQADASPGDGPAPSFVHVAAGAIVDGAGAPLALHCVNLGGWLEPEGYLLGTNVLALVRSPDELRANLVTLVGQAAAGNFWLQWEAAFITEADFARVAALGFDCVRLPINAKRVGRVTGGTVALDPVELAPIDHAVAWGAAHGVYVVLDLHATFGGANFAATSGDVPSTDLFPQLWVGANGEYPSAAAIANQQLTVQLWALLAARYADATAIAGFDLLNEPQLDDANKPSQQPVPQTVLVSFFADVIAAIRAHDPHHLLFVEGDQLATDFTAFTAPLDPNSAYEFHAYALTASSPWADPTVMPSPLDPLLARSASQQVPLWMGELGENTLTWQHEMVSLADAHGVGWAIWPWKRRATSHPVVETIALPASWAPVFAFLVGATTTPPVNAAQGLTDMLAAVELSACSEDASLAATLTAP